MGESNLGARGRAPTTTRIAAVLTLVLGIFAAYMTQALAVHDEGLFELGPPFAADILSDGNAATGPDWADGNGEQGIFDFADGVFTATLPADGLAAAFIEDDSSQRGQTDRTTFSGAGGSNKNNDPIGPDDCVEQGLPETCASWHWDGGNVPAKDDLFNVYAYAANDDSTADPPLDPDDPDDDHLILYAAVERLAPEGDSHVDLEFFQAQIGLDEEVPCNDPGSDPTPCNFDGIRSVDDIIISMDYVQGGGIGSVTVRRWDGTQYVQIGVAGGEGCFQNDAICVANNGSPINGGPWPNIDRGNNEITNLDTNAFTEFGIDVTALLGDTPCLSSFMPKTRSSQSFTAELKDFAGPAAFNICGAEIQIAPDATNEVGDPHTFTVTVSQKLGSQTSAAPDGTNVDVTLTDANGAVSEVSADTCASPGTVNGQCSVTFTSDVAGTVTGHASATLVIAGNTIVVETDGQGTNSDDAVKVFVDASITIDPDDTNSVGESHTFTVTVKQDAGDATGEVNAPDGTLVTVALTDSGGAVSSISANTCDNVGPGQIGTSSGQCSVTFTSSSAGTVTGHASVTLTVGGISLTRQTDASGSNSNDAVKVFVAGSLTWTKLDNAGVKQGGATFEVCRTHDFDTATLTFVDIVDVCVSVVDDEAPPADTPTTAKDQDTDAGEFSLTGLRLGRYTVKETAAPPGFEPDPDTVTVELSIASPDATISTSFVNNRPIVKITEFGYTNAPTGTPTAGVTSGTTTFTAKLQNFGGADVNVSGTLVVTDTSTGEDVVCTAVTPGDPPDPIGYGPSALQKNQGNTVTVTTTCTYTNFDDGATITAVLNTSYTLNGLLRTASGSPATITFTVQAD